MPETEPQRPVQALRMRNVKVSVWENRVEQGDDEVVRRSASIGKRYRDKDGNWHDTDVWFPEDLLRLAELAKEAAKSMELKVTNPAADGSAVEPADEMEPTAV